MMMVIILNDIYFFVNNDEMYMYEMKVDSRKIEYKVAKREI